MQKKKGAMAAWINILLFILVIFFLILFTKNKGGLSGMGKDLEAVIGYFRNIF